MLVMMVDVGSGVGLGVSFVTLATRSAGADVSPCHSAEHMV